MRQTASSALFFFLALARVACGQEEGTCSIDKDDCVEPKQSDRFSRDTLPEKWKWRMKEIEKANEQYVSCDNDAGDDDKCSTCYDEFIDNDLKVFGKISQSTLDKIREKIRHSVTYQILDGQLYRSPKDCLFPMRCKGIEHFLLKILKNLPNMEFVVNCHDWPFINKYFGDTPLPLFSFSKTKDYIDISYPAWTFWAGGPATDLYPTGLGRWDLMRDTLAKSRLKEPWDRKESRAFFRGSRTSGERDNLILLSRSNPDLVDAAYTKNQAWKSDKDTLGHGPAQEVKLEDHCRFKYLFNFRGVAASFRFKHLFLCQSVVFHVSGGDSSPHDNWTEFFYPAMRPWVHYVPVDPRATKDELKDLLDFARSQDVAMRQMAERGRQFVARHLRMSDVECYWTRLLRRYAEKLDFEVTERREDAELVKK